MTRPDWTTLPLREAHDAPVQWVDQIPPTRIIDTPPSAVLIRLTTHTYALPQTGTLRAIRYCMTNPNSGTLSPLGTIVARAILTGDVHLARLLAATRHSWTVPEARAIAGACRVARARWGADVTLGQFMRPGTYSIPDVAAASRPCVLGVRP